VGVFLVPRSPRLLALPLPDAAVLTMMEHLRPVLPTFSPFLARLWPFSEYRIAS